MMNEILNKKSITLYEDINNILTEFLNGISNIFHSNLVGVYLTGSLSYGDFSQNRSDIDLVVVLKDQVSEKVIESLKEFHQKLKNSSAKWSQRLECSYIHMSMLHEKTPPKEPRPYFNEGIFYKKAPYGNEWVVNQYQLWNYSIALIGPVFSSLTAQIDIADVQKSCIEDLLQEWQPKIVDQTYLQDSHHQAYTILQMCRILYTVLCKKVGSKKEAANWVKNNFSPKWCDLIEIAEKWKYATTIDKQENTTNFVRFVIQILKRKYDD